MGFYNMLQGGCTLHEGTGRQLCIQRQLSSARDGRHRPRQHHFGFRRCHLVQGSERPKSAAPAQPECSWLRRDRLTKIENPNPATGTNNWYTEDGYGGFGNSGASTGVYGGGSYSNCSDSNFATLELDRSLSLSQLAYSANQTELRSGPLLPAKQLQPGVLWRWKQCLYRYQFRATRPLRFRPLRSIASRMSCSRATSPGRATTISGTATSRTNINSITGKWGRRATSTATFATRSNIRRKL